MSLGSRTLLFAGVVALGLCRRVGSDASAAADPGAHPVAEVERRPPRANVSSISKFLSEPALGTSWFDRAGPTPTFVRDQSNGTVYTSLLGDDALLDCRVTALEADLVSWFRVDPHSNVPELLTVGFRPHSGDARFLLDFGAPNNYRLRVQSVQWHDEGVFICQLAVHPPAIMWFRLSLVRPVVHVLDGDAKPVTQLHYDQGSTIEMMCRVKRPPAYQTTVLWSRVRHKPDRDPDESPVEVLNHDVVRGGVRVETGREEDSALGHVLVSRLSLAAARLSDVGNYTCALASVPDDASDRAGLADTIALHVHRGEDPEAIQSRSTCCALPSSLNVFVVAVTWLCCRVQ